MTLTDHDLSELLAALKAGELTDTIRTSLEWVLQQLIEAEATAYIGAGRHQRTETRLTQRNGHRSRLLSTPAGDVELGIPKLREGSFFPSLLERRRRIDRALYAVVMEAWVHGVSTRKVDDLVKALGVASGVSKSEVSRICAELDGDLEAFRNRPLSHVAFPYVFADATYVKGRVRGRVVSRAVVVATGVTANGDREVLGVAVGDSEDGAFWTAFLRGLRARGLTGVQLVISDHHLGLKAAIGAVFIGASWQRCRVHFMRNVLARVPKASAEMVAAAVRTVFAQPDTAHVHRQLAEVVAMLKGQFPDVAAMLADASDDLLAFTTFPQAHWRKLWSTNPVRHEALTDRAEMKGLRLRAVAAACRSWRQPDPGGAGKGGSSLDNEGTGRHCQTARAQQARRRGVRVQKPVVEPPSSGTSARTWWMWAGQQCVLVAFGGGQLLVGLGLAGRRPR